LILASMVPGTRVHQPLLTGDGRSTLDALGVLGACVDWTEPTLCFTDSTRAPLSPVTLDCGNSGTTLRLLCGQAARSGQPVTLSGDASLRRRPNAPLLDALGQLGVEVVSDGGCAPIIVTGPLRSGLVRLSGQLSSQFVSSLLLALPFLEGDSQIEVTGPIASRPYLNLTTAIASAFGVEWHEEALGEGVRFHVPGRQSPRVIEFTVEGDWSAAAFPLVAAAVRGQPLRLTGLQEHSPQGDRALVDLLGCFGLDLDWEDDVLVLLGGDLHAAGLLDLSDTPDLFPPLCALAACAPGMTRLTATRNLRAKESDRISAMATALKVLGVHVEELEHGLVVTGGALHGGQVDTRSDHRVHMALAAVGSVAKNPVVLNHPECVEISYPFFHEHLSRIEGAAIDPSRL
jgi:3-phosphoshikimate 1-carboxyvinyltransferase